MSLSTSALVTLVQAKNYLRVNAAASLHIYAEYVGTGDAENVTFVLDYIPIEGSLRLYVDNELQVETDDYTVVLSTKTITFVVASTPGAGKIVTASYDKEASDDTFESYDDDLLESLIEAATKKAEDYTGRAFVQRNIVETHIGDNTQVLKLRIQPVVSVASITVGGDALTSYTERLSIGRIYHLIVWPLDYEVVVTYAAGYGADRAAAQVLVPDAVIAVLLIIAFLFENRTDKVDSMAISGVGNTSYKLPSQAEELLRPLRINVL